VRLLSQMPARLGFRIGNRGVTYTDRIVPPLSVSSSCRQSPINVFSPAKFVLVPPVSFLDIKYKSVPIESEKHVSNGHVSFVTSNPDYITSYNGHDYKLLQYHVHSPAEHQVNGKIYNAEVHFVHKDEVSNEYLVLAVFLDIAITSENVFDVAIYEAGLTSASTSVSLNMLQLSDVFSSDYFTYAGSLTTDPYNDDVTWVIFTQASGTDVTKIGHASNAGTPRAIQTNIHPAEVLSFKGVV
jgi:carbonic anhydrase